MSYELRLKRKGAKGAESAKAFIVVTFEPGSLRSWRRDAEFFMVEVPGGFLGV